MNNLNEISTAFEIHSPDKIRECFARGVNPNQLVGGKPLVYELINMYTRGPLFKDCIWVFVEHGLVMEDRVLLSVLLDDATALDELLKSNPARVNKRYTFNCAFTPLLEATLLHICSEYNHVACAEVLVKHGADVNATAGCDENGFGGHTPIFHTVNQDNNKSLDMLKYLLTLKPDLSVTVKGLIWGKGYDWETFIPSVNPASYAMMGLLRQFQRNEQQIYEVVDLLMRVAYQLEYTPLNVPNRYLVK